MALDLDFIAGLIDADGSLYLGFEKKSGKFSRKLILDISNKDKGVLDAVTATLGFGLVIKNGSTFAYRCNTHQAAQTIVESFENRLHGSAKLEMPLFKEALRLCQKDRSPLGYVKFVQLMYESNSQGKLRKYSMQHWLTIFATTPELRHLDPNYVNDLRTKSSPSDAMTGQYVSGYTQGDGSFNLASGNRRQANFSLTDPERSILRKIQYFLKLPESCLVNFNPKTAENNKMCHRLQLDRAEKSKDLILPHYDKFSVYGNQAKRYSLYRQGVLVLAARGADYKKKFIEIADKLKNLNEK